MSHFVIEASSYFLRLAEDTVLDFGPPCGLFALIMTGVRDHFLKVLLFPHLRNLSAGACIPCTCQNWELGDS